MSQRISSLNQKKLITKETMKSTVEVHFPPHIIKQMMKMMTNLNALNMKLTTLKNMPKKLLIITHMIQKKLLTKMDGDLNIMTPILIRITNIGAYLNRRSNKKQTKYGAFTLLHGLTPIKRYNNIFTA